MYPFFGFFGYIFFPKNPKNPITIYADIIQLESHYNIL